MRDQKNTHEQKNIVPLAVDWIILDWDMRYMLYVVLRALESDWPWTEQMGVVTEEERGGGKHMSNDKASREEWSTRRGEALDNGQEDTLAHLE